MKHSTTLEMAMMAACALANGGTARAQPAGGAAAPSGNPAAPSVPGAPVGGPANSGPSAATSQAPNQNPDFAPLPGSDFAPTSGGATNPPAATDAAHDSRVSARQTGSPDAPGLPQNLPGGPVAPSQGVAPASTPPVGRVGASADLRQARRIQDELSRAFPGAPGANGAPPAGGIDGLNVTYLNGKATLQGSVRTQAQKDAAAARAAALVNGVQNVDDQLIVR